VSIHATIYGDHFGIRGKPFSLLPDPDFIFWSKNHRRAYSMLEYGLVSFAPIIVITGEVGAGKTTLIQHLLRSAPCEFDIGMIANAHGRRGALLHWVLTAFGQAVGERVAYVRLFSQFQEFLAARAERGHRCVLIVDEAQNLSMPMLEELRCFSNLNGADSERLQIVLVGQPELRETIDRPKLLQFAQRVAADFHLAGMSRDAVHDYITHRLGVVGARREIFTPAACDKIYEASGGLPRVINQICDYALVNAFADDVGVVDDDLIEQVAADRGLRWHAGQKTGPLLSIASRAEARAKRS
jgi:type II secretory pathway predicted ATPase ExeA